MSSSADATDAEARRAETLFEQAMAYKAEGHYRAALEAFRSAAKLGHARAQYQAGLFFTPEGCRGVVEPDHVEAVRYLRLAADQGYVLAQVNLGTRLSGDEAVRYYRKAADAGNATAQVNLGACYSNGNGVAKDPVEAVRYYRLAADQGLPRAQAYLGVYYITGDGVAVKDPIEGVRYLRLAVDQGDADAQFQLGVCFQEGDCVAKDPVEAVRYYRLAADRNPHAMCALGGCYYNGTGVPESSVEAVRYFRIAADQGSAQAMYALGCCYDRGDGVSESCSEAMARFAAAAAKGHLEAKFEVAQCYRNGRGVTKDEAHAVRCYRDLIAAFADSEHPDDLVVKLKLEPRCIAACARLAQSRELAAMCCLGCGATLKLKTCDRCHVAKFCSVACIRRAWPQHKPNCALWCS